MVKFVKTAFVVSIVVAIVGCGDKNETGGESNQVIANVNGNELTVHQLNFEMGMATQNNKQVDPKKLEGVLLERIVNRELIVQQAKSQQIDRDARVMQAIERAKQEILAEAYLENVTKTVAAPTEDEVKKFHDENPDLFANRRIYQMQEVLFGEGIEKNVVEKQLVKSKALKDLADWAKQNKIPARAHVITEPSERIPSLVLQGLSATPDGRGFAITRENGTTAVIWRVASQPMPIAFEQAKPIIERMLLDQKRKAKAKEEVENLRKAAKIELKGQFAAQAPSATVSDEALPTGKASPTEGNSEAVDKGISGLK